MEFYAPIIEHCYRHTQARLLTEVRPTPSPPLMERPSHSQSRSVCPNVLGS